MRHINKQILTLLVLVIQVISLHAQSTAETFLRGNDKFNTVATVLVLIFIGIVTYLIRLDNKINKLK